MITLLKRGELKNRTQRDLFFLSPQFVGEREGERGWF